MLRMTFDFPENDLKMAQYCTDRAAEIAKNMGASHVHPKAQKGPYSIVPYQTTHNVGGTMMGDTPANSVANKYSQSWDVPNLFVTGAGLFPQLDFPHFRRRSRQDRSGGRVFRRLISAGAGPVGTWQKSGQSIIVAGRQRAHR